MAESAKSQDSSAAPRKRVRLGELLVSSGSLSPAQLDAALAEQKRTGRKLGRVLSDLGMVLEDDLQTLLAQHLKLPFVQLAQLQLHPEAVRLLPEALARRFRAIVIATDERGVQLGMADPTDLFAYDEIASRLKQPIRLVLVGESDLLRALDVVYRRTEEIASLAQEVREELREGDVDIDRLGIDEGSADAPILKMIQSLFQDALQVRASDIHLEPGDNHLRVRQRVDGLLQEQLIDGRRIAGALVTRLKLLCGLDISEKRLPQDGRFSVRVRERLIDVRLSTMPTQYGESCVMRLLDSGASLVPLEELGMPSGMLERFRAVIERSAGLLLVTGPTGSGKTTTLYSALSHLNQADTKIITAEDPVEYRLERVNQVQVNPKIGLDFARVLRTALRQDPDIMLIGEMRDAETVNIGLKAAVTGHMVFSTLHTLNAVASLHRLLDMGAPGYMVAASLHAVVAQRLVRKLCTNCARPAAPNGRELAWLAAQIGREKARTFEAVEAPGCPVCNHQGYQGRAALYEFLEIDGTLADLIRRGAIEEFGRRAVSRPDYLTLAQSGLQFAAAGHTSLREVISVTSGAEERVGPVGAGLPSDATELSDAEAVRVLAG